MRRGAAEAGAHAAHGRLAGSRGIEQVLNRDAARLGSVDDDLGVDGGRGERDRRAADATARSRSWSRCQVGMAA